MELIRRTVPYDASSALKLLEDTFGYEEVVVEAPQLMGQEVAVNTDIVWEAWALCCIYGEAVYRSRCLLYRQKP